jgi:putative sigma-54 modulation protein
MRIHLTVRHCELDPEDRLFTEQRLEKLARFVHDIQEAHVIVTAEKYRHTAEVTLKVRGHDIVGREQANEARTAVDHAIDRIEQQVRRLKEKRLSGAVATALAPPTPSTRSTPRLPSARTGTSGVDAGEE